MVKYEMLQRLAANYGLGDAREGLSTIRETERSCFYREFSAVVFNDGFI